LNWQIMLVMLAPVHFRKLSIFQSHSRLAGRAEYYDVM